MKKYYFTISSSQGGPGCVEVTASTWSMARAIMFERWGYDWAFQYDSLEDVHVLDRLIIAKYSEDVEVVE